MHQFFFARFEMCVPNSDLSSFRQTPRTLTFADLDSSPGMNRYRSPAKSKPIFPPIVLLPIILIFTWLLLLFDHHPASRSSPPRSSSSRSPIAALGLQPPSASILRGATAAAVANQSGDYTLDASTLVASPAPSSVSNIRSLIDDEKRQLVIHFIRIFL